MKTVAFLLAMIVAWAIVPESAVAQLQSCGFCTQEPGTINIECTTEVGETSELLCEDVFLGFLCVGCSGFASGAHQAISPDGTLLLHAGIRQIADERLALFGESIAPGVYVARNTCGNAISSRWYSEDASDAIRDASALLRV